MGVQRRVQCQEVFGQLDCQDFIMAGLRAGRDASINSDPEFWVAEGATHQDKESKRRRSGGRSDEFSLNTLSLRYLGDSQAETLRKLLDL